jgi:hypothetical protein
MEPGADELLPTPYSLLPTLAAVPQSVATGGVPIDRRQSLGPGTRKEGRKAETA